MFARVNTFLSLSFNSACVEKTLLPCVRANILRAFQEGIKARIIIDGVPGCKSL